MVRLIDPGNTLMQALCLLSEMMYPPHPVAESIHKKMAARGYDLWYEQREDVLRSYTDHFPEPIPIEQNKEFKTIRNAVIQKAMKIVSGIRQAEELDPRQDEWDVGLPPGGEPDMETMADPGYWMERF